MLKLPHRQFVHTIPKILRIYFRYDRKLFSEITRLIYDMMVAYYNEACNKKIMTAAIISYQSSGEFLRFNPNLHSLILEGGFDEHGNFFFIPIADTSRMTECFRQLVIKRFTEKELISQSLADNLLSWRNSGFSIDNSIRITGSNDKARESLSQYIARCPVSLQKLDYDDVNGKVIFNTKYNSYFKKD